MKSTKEIVMPHVEEWSFYYDLQRFGKTHVITDATTGLSFVPLIGTSDQLGRMATWLLDPHVTAYLYRHQTPPRSVREVEKEFRTAQDSFMSLWQEIVWNGIPVGHIGLQGMNRAEKSTSFSILLGEKEARGKGLGLRSVILEFAAAKCLFGFSTMNFLVHQRNRRMIDIVRQFPVKTERDEGEWVRVIVELSRFRPPADLQVVVSKYGL